MYSTIRAEQLTPHIGAEISGIDLTKPLTNSAVDELHDALARFGVIFFRDQPISLDDHVALASHFGDLHLHVGPSTESKPLPDNPAIRILHFDEHSERVAGEEWHTDQSCAAIPPLGSILHLTTVPPSGGGATLFASMYAAYDDLSERMKTYLDGLTAVHDGRKVFGPNAPVTTHPVVPRHPVSGRKLIYVNKAMGSHINGLPRNESDWIVDYLTHHCTKPDYQIRFQWRAHSIAFWDNRCTQHKAIWDYFPHVRSGYRIQIKGSGAPRA